MKRLWGYFIEVKRVFWAEFKLFPTLLKIALEKRELSYLEFIYRIYLLIFVHLYTFSEILEANMLGADIKIADLKNYRSQIKWVLDCNELNFQELGGYVDKGQFYSACKGLNLPAPNLLGTLYLEGSYVVSDKNWMGEKGLKEFFERILPDSFFIKPAFGECGNDMHSLRRVGKTFIHYNGQEYTFERLLELLKTEPAKYNHFFDKLAKPGKLLIVENLKSHRALQQLTGSDGVMSARIATFVRSNGQVEIVESAFKIICGDNYVDNWRTSGENYFCYVNANSGQIVRVDAPSKDGYTSYNAEFHPNTNRRLIGFTVPHWKDAVALAKDAALKFMPMRCLGWDIAISDAGVCLLEANCCWGHAQNELRNFKQIKNLILEYNQSSLRSSPLELKTEVARKVAA